MGFFPKLNVPESQKTKEWCGTIIDSIVKYYGGNSSLTNEKIKDYENYNIYSGNFDAKQYSYMTDIYGMTSPVRLVNYPIIHTKIKTLLGEYEIQPIPYSVEAINSDAVSRKADNYLTTLTNALTLDRRKKIEQITGIDLGTEGEKEIENVNEIKGMNFREAIEDTAQVIIDDLIDRFNWKETFTDGLRDVCICGKEFFKVDTYNFYPQIRRIDPRSLIYEIDSKGKNLQDSLFVVEERLLTIPQILGEFGHLMTPDEINSLDDLVGKSRDQFNTFNTGFQWYFEDKDQLRIRVIHGEWRSKRKFKVKVSENKYDESNPFIKILPDNYTPKKDDVIKTRDLDDVWEGTRIGHELLVGCRRRPNQSRREATGYNNTPLSYFGVIENSIDGRTLSIVDVLKNIQIMTNFAWYHIELAMSRAGGKAVIYDVAYKPKEYSATEVIYHLKNSGIVLINSMQEGLQNRVPNYLQQADFTLSDSVTQLVNLLIMLDNTADKLTGISPARTGVVGDTVRGDQMSVNQSNLITEPLISMHNRNIASMLNYVVDLAKMLYPSGHMVYVLGDAGVKILEVTEDFGINDYGVRIVGDSRDRANRRKIEEFMGMALSSGQIGILEAVKIVNADSAIEAEKILTGAVESMRKIQQEQVQAEQQSQAQAQQQEAEIAGQEMQIKADANQAKRDVATITTQTDLAKQDKKADAELERLDAKHKSDLDKEFLKQSGQENKNKKPIKK